MALTRQVSSIFWEVDERIEACPEDSGARRQSLPARSFGKELAFSSHRSPYPHPNRLCSAQGGEAALRYRLRLSLCLGSKLPIPNTRLRQTSYRKECLPTLVSALFTLDTSPEIGEKDP